MLYSKFSASFWLLSNHTCVVSLGTHTQTHTHTHTHTHVSLKNYAKTHCLSILSCGSKGQPGRPYLLRLLNLLKRAFDSPRLCDVWVDLLIFIITFVQSLIGIRLLLSRMIEFFLNVFTEFLYKRLFEPATSCVRNKDVTKQRTRHKLQTGFINWS